MTDYDLNAFVRDAVAHRDTWRKTITRKLFRADAQLRAETTYRNAIRADAERLTAAATKDARAAMTRAVSARTGAEEKLDAADLLAGELRQRLADANEAARKSDVQGKHLRGKIALLEAENDGLKATLKAHTHRVEELERHLDLAADRINEAETRATELEDAGQLVSTELAALHAKLAVQESQGAAPEPNGTPPAPAAKPRTAPRGPRTATGTRKPRTAGQDKAGDAQAVTEPQGDAG